MAATATKARGIIFSAPMVRAILEWRKTQTRRIVKPQPQYGVTGSGYSVLARNPSAAHPWVSPGQWIVCPYGQPGSLLWVRESLHWTLGDNDENVWVYAAGGDVVPVGSDEAEEWLEARPFRQQVVPPRFMPRWASRLTLRVTGVRVERLQEMSEPDLRAEGYRSPQPLAAFVHSWDTKTGGTKPGCSWADNPFVWVVSFERVAGAEAESGVGE